LPKYVVFTKTGFWKFEIWKDFGRKMDKNIFFQFTLKEQDTENCTPFEL